MGISLREGHDRVTLRFDSGVIDNGRKFAESNGLSLSQLIELLLKNATLKDYKNIEDIPVSNVLFTLSNRNRKSKK